MKPGVCRRLCKMQVELVREFERSGLSGPRFAELAGVNYQTFATWRRRHARASLNSPAW